jgi:hypothetical protein
MKRFFLLIVILAFTTLLAEAQWSPSGSNIYYNNGNVGIGTTSPQKDLHILTSSDGVSSILHRNGTTVGQHTGIGFAVTSSSGIIEGHQKASILFERTKSYARGSLHFATNDSNDPANVALSDSRMTITSSGQIGIGTATPQSLLDVSAGSIINTTSLFQDYYLGISNPKKSNNYGAGIAFTHSQSWTSNHTPGAAIVFERIGRWSQGQLHFFVKNSTEQTGSLINAMTLNSSGSLSIGTTDPKGYKLAVAGKVIAEEVVVKLQSHWPDYVFKPEYTLRPLAEVEAHIKTHGHLPEVPSAQQVEESGVGLAEMNAILLKKVEELTLYILELKKENETQNIEIQKLKK